MDIEPWVRQPGEGSKPYEAFSLYRDMGARRSQLAVAEQRGVSRSCIAKWAAEWKWTERTEEYDSAPVRAVVAAYEAMAREIAEQHRALADKLMRKLSRNLDLLEDGEDPSMRWSAAHTSARMGHQLATDLSRPKDTAKDEINRQISALIERLAQGD